MSSRKRAQQSVSLTLASAVVVWLAGITAAVADPVDLSQVPVVNNTSVAPNVALTFDDSGSMTSNYLGDDRPFDGKAWDNSPWRCAGVIDPRPPVKPNAPTVNEQLRALPMNGVYYNPNTTYAPPQYADGTSFPPADKTLRKVFLDGIAVNRKTNRKTAATSATVYANTNSTANADDTKLADILSSTKSNYWQCNSGYANYFDGSKTDPDNTSNKPAGGPYYYRLKKDVILTANAGKPDAASITKIYTANNWEAVPVPATARDYQNFANWYAYYRTRNLMARTSVSLAFDKVGEKVRVIWQNLNTNPIVNTDTTASAIYPFADNATSTDATARTWRTKFFDWNFEVPAASYTPNREAVARVGEYYKRGSPTMRGATNPYWEPIKNMANGGMELSCRQNYHMLVTDGYWNKQSTVNFPATYLDGQKYVTDFTLPKDFGATAGRAYSASSAHTMVYWNQDKPPAAVNPTLADIAFNYWATDLRTDLDNRVPPYLNDESVGITGAAPTTPPKSAWDLDEVYFNPANDPATWQHMVQFMVGLGVPGNLVQDDATLLRLRTGAGPTKWPAPTQVADTTGAAQQAKIDDTWHAAVNSRGKYFDAGSPQELVNALTDILTSITLRRNSTSALSVSSSVINAGSVAYSTGYDTTNWSGNVVASTLTDAGARGTSLWDAGCVLTGGPCLSTGTNAGDGLKPGDRKILTAKLPTGGGVAFQWSSLSSQQQQWLNQNPASTTACTSGTGTTGGCDGAGSLRLAYLRGDRSQEASSATPQFRTRSSLLGAVVNSSAVYHSLPSSGYRDIFPSNSPEGLAAASASKATYEKFVYDHKSNRAVLYVGANDGMLHAFDANTGKELWAYVPYAVSQNLNKLTATPFKFQSFVDNSPEIMDVFTGGKWRTLLVGTLRMGGRGVYALDVTDPDAVSESSAGATVMWEFSGSSSGAANLGYTFGQPNVVRLRNGKWAVLVPAGYFQDPATDNADPTSALPAASLKYSSLFVLDAENGSVITEMKTPSSVVSYGLATAVVGNYGRDQMADFAVAGDLVGNLWRFDLTDLSTVDQIFAPATSGAQPITVMPQLFPDTTTQGVIAVFGTGKYLGAKDRDVKSMPVQAYYGIREYGKRSSKYPVRLADLVQQTLTVDTATTYRSLTGNKVGPEKKGWYFNLDKVEGERNVLRAGRLINSNRAVLESLIPAGDDPCDPSIKGALMIVDAATGGPPAGPPPVGGGPALPAGSTQIVGRQVKDPPTTGAPPMVTPPGGGAVIIPGTEIPGVTPPVTISDSYWRRRAWRTMSDGL